MTLTIYVTSYFMSNCSENLGGLSLLVSINVHGNRLKWITGIPLKRPKPVACASIHQSIFLSEWMLDSYPIGRYINSRFSSASELRWLPKWEKSHPQNSNGSWRGCISSAVTALFYRACPAAEWRRRQTLSVCVCSFGSTFNTLRFSESFYARRNATWEQQLV